MTMRKRVLATLLAVALPCAVAAQVEKQVEVTKAYVPSIESAAKLAIAPDMTDTARMRPEIDYTITPLSLRTTLSPRPIRPATVTYWKFNRPLPFYLKVGAGYPLNSVLDFYASSQNPGTGYIVGYVNHEGRYADIRNDFGIKNPSTRMTNRIGVAAGKYFGRRTLEGEVSYDNRLYHAYGGYLKPSTSGSSGSRILSTYKPGARVDYGDAQAAFRFGDDFKDLSRFNFEIALRGGFFSGYPELYQWDAGAGPGEDPNYRRLYDNSLQTNFETSARLARGFGRHRLSVEVGYERLAGQKSIDGYKEHIIRAGLRYGVDGGVVRFEAGADYYHDKIGSREAGNYIVPFAHLDFNLGTAGLKPFLEIDGGVSDNSFRSLTQQNPYLLQAWALDKSSVDYNGRFGIGGELWREKFNYRAYVEFSIRDNHTYWYNTAYSDTYTALYPEVALARQTVTSFNGEAEYRPIGPLRMTLGVHGYLYNNETPYHDGSSSFEGDFSLRYQGRKIAFGAGVAVRTSREWTLININGQSSSEEERSSFEAPFAADVRVDFEWRVSRRVSVFAEGRNLANARLYEYAWYPEYGASFTLGVKANF